MFYYLIYCFYYYFCSFCYFFPVVSVCWRLRFANEQSFFVSFRSICTRQFPTVTWHKCIVNTTLLFTSLLFVLLWVCHCVGTISVRILNTYQWDIRVGQNDPGTVVGGLSHACFVYLNHILNNSGALNIDAMGTNRSTFPNKKSPRQ